MTPEEFRAALYIIGWTQRQLASDILGVHHCTVQRWAAGAYPVPGPIASWLRRLARFHEQHQLPGDWRAAA